jgi:hypothetical protein
MKQILLILACFTLTTTAIAAAPAVPRTFICASITPDTLPEMSVLFQSLEHYYSQKLKAALAEYEITEKKRWLKYLPSVGLGYNLTTNQEGQLTSKLRPTLSYSTNIIYQGFQNKAARQAKILSITQTNRLELEAEKRALNGLMKKYDFELQDLDFMKKMGELDNELFKIATAQFEAAELAPSAYLPKKQAFLKKQYALFKKAQVIEELRNEILIRAKSGSH